MNTKLALKATFTTLLIPGTVILLVPYFILHRSRVTDWPQPSFVTFLAIISGLTGLAVLFHCIWGFAVHGKGTLAPIDPPKGLVIHGSYRHTRNPMYLAVILVLLSEASYFGSFSVLIYAAAVFLGFHLFVVLYEEPHLQSRFGESYMEYASAIPRWRITLRGFQSQESPHEQRAR